MTLPKPGHKWVYKNPYHEPKRRCVACGRTTRNQSYMRLLEIETPMGNEMYVCADEVDCADRAIKFLDDLDRGWSRACSEDRLVLYGA
jgi:hypothetical protein